MDLTDEISSIPVVTRQVCIGPNDRDISRLGQALWSLRKSRADDRAEWLAVACALKSGGDDLFPLFDAWSHQSIKYGDTRKVWESIDQPRVALETIFRWAREDKQVEEDRRESAIFPLLTCAELDGGDYSVTFLIDDILVSGQPTLCGGVSKTLKTSVCLDASIALTTGCNFLGRFPVLRQARVLIMSGESGLGVIQETARRICRARGVQLDRISDLLWSTELPRCDDPIDLVRLDRTLAHARVEVLFIDPCYLALGGDDHGDVFKQGTLLRKINQVCTDNGAGLILVHHCKKSAARLRTAPQLEDMAMAGFAEFARQWWLIGRREPFRAGEPHQLMLAVGGSAGHSGEYELSIAEGVLKDAGGRRWDVEVRNHFGACEGKSDVEGVEDALRDNPIGLTIQGLMDQTGLTRPRVKRALESPLFLPALVPHSQSPNKTFPGWKLAQDVAQPLSNSPAHQ